jgi:23S rRNA (uracil1939-C5)-methyltransferase
MYEEEGIKADVVFVDPPRKGCDQKLLDTIIKMKPNKMVYVSCNVATLGRDLKYLLENGFELIKVQPVDQFPQTAHCESVCVLKYK